MLFAYYVHHLSPFLVEFAPGFGVRWYGLAYVAAFLVGIALYKRLARQGYSDLQPEAVSDFIIWGAIFGVVLGGRLGYMLLYDFDAFRANPLIFFRLWDGGMASHGGMIGLALYTLWYARRHRVSWRNLGDNLVVVAPLGLLFGRLANFINGELFGRVAAVPWAMQFPKELYIAPVSEQDAALRAAAAINPAWNTIDQIEAASRTSAQLREALAQILTPRHPSQLYEATLEGALLFTGLWLLRTRVRLPNGVLTGVFFIAYAALRITGEMFREPDAPLTGPFTRGQFLSFFLVLLGLGFLISAWLRPSWPSRWKR
jgi:phosphatidylglycerol:prolipoprotein diacylglycerol transferase